MIRHKMSPRSEGGGWTFGSIFRSFMLMLAAFASLTVSTPAIAQEDDGGLFGGVTDFFTIENNAEGFDQRREGAKVLLESYPCVACDIFDNFASAVFDGMSAVDDEGPSLIPVVTGFASLFALFYLGSAFVAGDASDLPGRWQVFWRLCLAVAAASVVLAAPVTIMWDYVYSILFSIGKGVVNVVGGNSGTCARPGPGITADAPAGALEALSYMSTTVCGAYEMTLDGIANGLAMMTQRDGIANTLVYIFSGMFVVLIYGFLAITFPLRFIDVVIRLAIVSIITPLLVVCLVFKPTRGYFSIAISNVLNATAQFAILTVIFSIGKRVFDRMVDITVQAPPQSDSGAFGLGSIAGEQDFTAVVVQALVLVGIAVVFNGLVKSVPAIAAEFSRSSGGGGDAGGNAAVGMIGRVTTTTVGGTGAALGLSKMRGMAMANQARQADMIGKAVGNAMGRTGRGVS